MTVESLESRMLGMTLSRMVTMAYARTEEGESRSARFLDSFKPSNEVTFVSLTARSHEWGPER